MGSSAIDVMYYICTTDSDLLALIPKGNVHFAYVPESTPKPYAVIETVIADNTASTICESYAGKPTIQVRSVHLYDEDDSNGANEEAEAYGRKLIEKYQFYRGTIDGVLVKMMRLTGVVVTPDLENPSQCNGVTTADIEYIENW